MSREKQIESTDWLTARYSEEEIAKMKAEAIKEVENELREKQIDELIRENESLAKTVNEASSLIRKLRNKVEKSKTEIASEIFAELENLNIHITNEFDMRRYFELKKKYTEDSQ